MAGNPAFTELLIGLGFRSVSVVPREILEIKSVIRSLDIERAEALARRVLESGLIREVKEHLAASSRGLSLSRLTSCMSVQP
jgi:phosphotransferase system enzyme I (PtsI)